MYLYMRFKTSMYLKTSFFFWQLSVDIQELSAFWVIFYRSHAIPKKYLYLKIVLSVCDM